VSTEECPVCLGSGYTTEVGDSEDGPEPYTEQCYQCGGSREWVAEFPRECLYCEDCGTETVAAAHAAERLAIDANMELAKVRAERDALRDRLASTQEDVDALNGCLDRAQARIAELEAALRLATAAAEAMKVHADVAMETLASTQEDVDSLNACMERAQARIVGLETALRIATEASMPVVYVVTVNDRAIVEEQRVFRSLQDAQENYRDRAEVRGGASVCLASRAVE